MDKPSALDALRTVLRAELAVQEQMTAMARDEATSPESRPENQYDTRALEASYLAAGQGERLAELRQLVAWIQVVHPPMVRGDSGALVEVEVDDRVQWIVLGPRGGTKAEVDGQTVALVSVTSPLGRLLVGGAEGDGDELERPGGTVSVEIQSVQ